MKILYAEDELGLSMATTEILKMEGFDVTHVEDGQQALDALKDNYFDVCVFDIMMPNVSGLDVVKYMRNAGNFTPVLMLTAKTTTDDRVEGLSTGADDYLCKPFEMKELVARIKSMGRRSSNEYQQEILTFKNITLDMSRNELKTDNSSLMLTVKEARLLALYIKNPGKKFDVDEINNSVMGDEASPNSPKLYSSYLQNKLVQVAAEAKIIIDEGFYLE